MYSFFILFGLLTIMFILFYININSIQQFQKDAIDKLTTNMYTDNTVDYILNPSDLGLFADDYQLEVIKNIKQFQDLQNSSNFDN